MKDHVKRPSGQPRRNASRRVRTASRVWISYSSLLIGITSRETSQVNTRIGMLKVRKRLPISCGGSGGFPPLSAAVRDGIANPDAAAAEAAKPVLTKSRRVKARLGEPSIRAAAASCKAQDGTLARLDDSVQLTFIFMIGLASRRYSLYPHVVGQGARPLLNAFTSPAASSGTCCSSRQSRCSPKK